MGDAALELYNSLKSYRALQDLISEGEAEGLHLECKSPQTPKLNRDMKQKLSLAISGFSNTAGGIIIWGISTTKQQHSGLDVLSQLEPIGNIKQLSNRISHTIPSLTSPPVLNTQVKLIKRRTTDTKGIALTYVPLKGGDPVQSNLDNKFYFRTGGEFKPAPYEMIKRLFNATDSPDLCVLLPPELVTPPAKSQGSWQINIGLGNRSIAVAEKISVSVLFENASACKKALINRFQDVSHFNPGECRFSYSGSPLVVHRGFDVVIGTLIVQMKGGKRPKRRLDLAFELFANKMRASKFRFSFNLARNNYSVKKLSEDFLY